MLTILCLRERGWVSTFPADGDPVPACDGFYLPGCYPELHADELAAKPTLRSIRGMAEDGAPILEECGGLMTRVESLETSDGERYEISDVLPADIRMQGRYHTLDHVDLTAVRDTVTAFRRETLRGHEFPYSTDSVAGDASLAFAVELRDLR